MCKSALLFAILWPSVCLAGPVWSNQSSDPRIPALDAKPTALNGTAAPQGSFWSENQTEGDDLSTANSVLGYQANTVSAQTGAFRLEDDFQVERGLELQAVDVFAHRINFSGGNFLSTSGLKIWRDMPGSGELVFNETGASVTILDDYEVAPGVVGHIYRISNSLVANGSNPPNTNRLVKKVRFSLPSSLYLAPGHYWIDVKLNSSSPFPSWTSSVRDGHRGFEDANALQLDPYHGYVSIVDPGWPGPESDVKMELPFMLEGRLRIAPTEVAITEGEFFAGNVASLAVADGNRYRLFDDAESLTGTIEISAPKAEAPLSRLEVDVTIGASRPGLIARAEQWNADTAAYEEILSEEIGISEQTIVREVESAASDDLRSRVSVDPFNDEVPSQDGWLIAVDKFNWIVSY